MEVGNLRTRGGKTVHDKAHLSQDEPFSNIPKHMPIEPDPSHIMHIYKSQNTLDLIKTLITSHICSC
jgi:hypothetical protein